VNSSELKLSEGTKEEGMNTFEAVVDRPLAVSFAKAAELTSVSKASLRRYARDGRLKTVRFGRRRIIPYGALTELLRNGAHHSSSSLESTQ
jgi:excisionase family DNA binding protein